LLGINCRVVAMENSIFETLLELPFFQGMGRSDVIQIMNSLPLKTKSVPAGRNIVMQNENCQHLIFILKGTSRIVTQAEQHLFTMSERIQGPAVIQPEALFGIYPHYRSTYQAQTEVWMINIPKSAALQIIATYDIFRLNYLNYLSSIIFKKQRPCWNILPGESLEQRIVRFILQHIQYPAGEKTLTIRMIDLADILNDTRINVSQSLNRMQKEGKLILKRKEIIIPSIEKLADITN
jgi:CRP-like cAMP-binding protein